MKAAEMFADHHRDEIEGNWAKNLKFINKTDIHRRIIENEQSYWSN
jgi:hypothetical protein